MHIAPKSRILIVTAVAAERDAVLQGLQGNTKFDVLIGGVGPIMTAATTAKALAREGYELVISAGIAGAFKRKADVGSLVVADKIISADLGAETPKGFSSLDELGFGSTCIKTDTGLVKKLTERLLAAKLPAVIAPIITVSTVTGTDESAARLAERVPGAAAEAMEGYGIAIAARAYDLPVLELRAISNMVGPRERTAWRIKEALEILQEASSVLLEVLV